MSWFQLDPESIAQRARTDARSVPSLAASVTRGIVGFTFVSVAGFAPWALGGRWLHRHVGEVGMYVACLAVFLGLAGPALHRLIIGAGSLGRFYKLFTIVFSAYAVAWIAGWMALRGDAGSITGLLAGTAIMGWMLARAFDAQRQLVKIVVALFVLNTAGYYLGGWFEATLPALRDPFTFGLTKATRFTIGMFMWGVCYGVGLGAGLGLAFHACQTEARRLILGGSITAKA